MLTSPASRFSCPSTSPLVPAAPASPAAWGWSLTSASVAARRCACKVVHLHERLHPCHCHSTMLHKAKQRELHAHAKSCGAKQGAAQQATHKHVVSLTIFCSSNGSNQSSLRLT
eukprot:GHRQ01016374.1.p2 GENE.GHRQ01016374.1~~GHRQ01016374.1.p2  ORF type:complete len:114 (-),score=19.58 GHRQ01016374.1:57-398(-)